MSLMLDDLRLWTNYTPAPSESERRRILSLVTDPATAASLLSFGIRPSSALDLEPSGHGGDLMKPFEVSDAHLIDENIVVDIVTGMRFRCMPDGELAFDLKASHDFIDTVELLILAASRSRQWEFERYEQLVYFDGPQPYTKVVRFPRPLTFHVSSREELTTVVADLHELFCAVSPARRLWFRGQTREHALPLERPAELCQKLYGVPEQPSLLPSAGRYAIKHPEEMSFGFAFAGPNHQWKKPFLIWIMRENARWFRHDPRALDVLTRVLADADDMQFARVLMALRSDSKMAGLEPDVFWPDEADDLRQWFFAFMKPHSFAITLQQYGYISTLLDVTEDLEVALYFTHAHMNGGQMRKGPPATGRVIYVFAERPSGDFFRHREDLFWGGEDWIQRRPPRLDRQKAGFIMGSTCRTQNFYGNMIVARIYLTSDAIETSISDDELFPSPADDLLYQTLRESRPELVGLY
jgi:hypothetical protein